MSRRKQARPIRVLEDEDGPPTGAFPTTVLGKSRICFYGFHLDLTLLLTFHIYDHQFLLSHSM